MPESPVLISLASRQAWPQLLIWKALKPARVLLLHSKVESESEVPAQRLQTFLRGAGTPCAREPIPHDDYQGILSALDAIAQKQSLCLTEARLNITGGNKLMAMAAFDWARDHGMPSCYLERDNFLFRFKAGSVKDRSVMEKLDAHICDDLDPLDVIRCQLDAAELERAGEQITLNGEGRNLTLAQFNAALSSRPDTVPGFLQVTGSLSQPAARGDALELLAAAVLLKLGVASVRRSMRIRPPKMVALPGDPPLENEFDLVFNHNGRLWVVDCKDRKPPENLAAGVAKMLKKLHSNPFAQPAFRAEWNKVEKLLSASPMKVMKEDILAAQALGGLLGQVICVRKSEPTPEMMNFSESKKIHLVTRSRLIEHFQAIKGLFR